MFGIQNRFQNNIWASEEIRIHGMKSKRLLHAVIGLLAGVCIASVTHALDPFEDRTTEGVHSFHRVPMTDGTLLATDVYLPEGEGPWPVVLERSLYSRNQGMNGFIRDGYAAVIQDVRGFGNSEGDSHVFYSDGWRPGLTDGADTVAWIKAQPWCNGKIATSGTSALAMTQMLLAPATKDICAQYINKVPANFYFDVIYLGGVFRKNLTEGWLTALGQVPTIAFYRDLPRYEEYWTYYNTVAQAGNITAPGVFVGGWFDIFLQGTLDGFVARETKGGPGARGRNYLVMEWGTHGGDTTHDYKYKANRHDFSDSDLRGRFFEYYLKGNTSALDGIAKVHYYILGDDTDPDAPGNEWRTADTWPPYPVQETPLYLGADGLLAASPVPDGGAFLEFTFDPNNPYPTWGGANLLPNLVSGPYDQRKHSASRTDLLKFATAPLDAPLEILGKVKARLFVSSDAPDTDFTAKLVDIYPEGDGREIIVLDHIRRVKTRQGFDREAPPLQGQDDIIELEIDLWSTAWIFNRGHRIGLHVSSSNYPRFEVNPNTGADHPVEGGEMRVARNRVHYSAAHPSALLLPVPQK